jgi:hypothetical protein
MVTDLLKSALYDRPLGAFWRLPVGGEHAIPHMTQFYCEC